MTAFLAYTPSPLWFATRAAGTVTLLLLTGTVVLGLSTTVRLRGTIWPKYVNNPLHRNVSILTLVFLGLHIVTSLLDPFAKLGIKDATIPLASSYRPVWLGLGVVAMELCVALAVSTALKRFIGQTAWRTIHWTSYICWPVAVLHGLGTGSDARRGWFLLVNIACVMAVFAAMVNYRLIYGWPKRPVLRLSAAVLSALGVVWLTLWTINGPMAPGWARIAGTPPGLLGAGQSTPGK